MSSSPQLSDAIRRIWAGPEQADEVIADLQRAGGTAIEALAKIATDEALAPQTRSSAVWLLGRLKKLGASKNIQALHPLLAVLADPDASLRGGAAQALGVLCDRRATAKLIQVLLVDPDPMVRQLAAHSLGDLASPNATRALRGALTNQAQDSGVRGAAAEALGASFAFDSASELIAGLSDPSPEVRFWCAYALGFLRIKSAVRELERLKADDAEVPGWWSVSQEATWAIEAIAGPLWDEQA